MSNSKIIMAAGLAGVVIGMMIAPKKGTELQKSILDTIDELGEEAVEMKKKLLGIAETVKTTVTTAKENVEEKVEQVKEGVDDVKTVADHLKTIFS